MPAHRLPVRPDLDQLHHQAKERLHAMHAGGNGGVKLADAQFALARDYGVSSRTRLVQAVRRENLREPGIAAADRGVRRRSLSERQIIGAAAAARVREPRNDLARKESCCARDIGWPF